MPCFILVLVEGLCIEFHKVHKHLLYESTRYFQLQFINLAYT